MCRDHSGENSASVPELSRSPGKVRKRSADDEIEGGGKQTVRARKPPPRGSADRDVLLRAN